VETSTLGRRALVDVAFPMAEGTGDPFLVEDEGGAGGLAVLRGIVQSHGGEIQFDPVPGVAAARICVELPRAADVATTGSLSGGGAVARTRGGGSTGPLTAVIVEPDAVSQRTLVTLLAQRGHRAIPVGSPEEALDLAQRVKCDLVMCASRMSPGFQWMPFYEKIRAHTDEFVLLMEASERGHSFAPGDGHVVRKPVTEADVDRVLGELNDADASVLQH
jgi:CheY-like chemotaxis protein